MKEVEGRTVCLRRPDTPCGLLGRASEGYPCVGEGTVSENVLKGSDGSDFGLAVAVQARNTDNRSSVYSLVGGPKGMTSKSVRTEE